MQRGLSAIAELLVQTRHSCNDWLLVYDKQLGQCQASYTLYIKIDAGRVMLIIYHLQTLVVRPHYC